jgi:hypothetical protein
MHPGYCFFDSAALLLQWQAGRAPERKLEIFKLLSKNS